MTQTVTPFDSLLTEIELAIDGKLYFLALSMVLVLPDFCASLAASDGRTSAKSYTEWCDKNLGKKFNFVTGTDLYSMRCGVLHNGRFGDMKHNVARVLFTLPGNVTFVNCKMNDAYVYSVVEFCREFMDAVRAWYAASSNDVNVVENLPRMMTLHPHGMPPYIKGYPLIG